MSLKITTEERKPGVFVAKLAGRLDSATCPACEEKIKPLLKKSTRILMLDLKDLDYISSMGLRIVLEAQKALRGPGRHVLLLHVQPQVAKVFDLADILPKTSIFDSVESADIFLEAVQNRELLKNQDIPD
jgi:anti-anti-sigma factor